MKTEYLDSNKSGINLSLDLIDALRKNDQTAQLKVYKLYYKEMYNITLRIVADPVEAEEIMQESFLEAFEGISKYSEKGPFLVWLKCFVLNRSVDFLRRNFTKRI